MQDRIIRHKEYTRRVGEDPEEIRDWVWPQ
jgi:hypothetical protein